MIAEANDLQRRLVNGQNRDGGWGYQPGISWTEPTALAVLALAAHTSTGSVYARACEWLARTQRQDGGWAPKPDVETSTWVTSLAVLALFETGTDFSRLENAVEWILRQLDAESSGITSLLLRAIGMAPAKVAGGAPWFPGTASWIAPSVASVLALSRVANARLLRNSQALSTAIRRAQQYILSRRCRDGGWNHGGSSFRSENAQSYPEMTGMALTALKGVQPTVLDIPLKLAEDSFANVRSAEAVSWLQLALMCHGRAVPSVTALPCRTSRDVSLRLLALAGPTDRNRILMQDLAN